MDKIIENSLKIAELMGRKIRIPITGAFGDVIFEELNTEAINPFMEYNGLMPIVFECNYEQDDLDIEIVIYGSGLDVHLDDEDILITTFDTKESFIEAIQLACIKYLELKNEIRG